MAFNLPFPTIIWKPVVPMKSLYGPVTDVSSKHRDGAPKTMRFLLDRSILVYTNVYDRRRVETEPMLTKWRPRGGRNRGRGVGGSGRRETETLTAKMAGIFKRQHLFIVQVGQE